MTRQGLVRRRRDRVDGRVLRVHLTPRGRALRPVLIPEAEAVNDWFFQGFSAAERTTSLQFLHRALDNLESGEEI
jgi:DNA-binding MarR family transcriptional regulator